MKVFIPNNSKTEIGGGWTFLRNFKKAAQKYAPELEIASNIDEADLLFAFGPTTVSGEDIQRAKAQGKPFVLRMDGVPEDNRNSGKGTRRLVEYAQQADFIVFQTFFIQLTMGKMLGSLGVKASTKTIYNGVDTDIFTPEGPKFPIKSAQFEINKDTVKMLHVNYRKDNNKRVEEVIAMFREYWHINNNSLLLLMGRYPTEWQEHHMGFFAGERFGQVGVITDDQMKAMIMRSCDFMFYPSFADPAPNVVLEAMACGLPIIYQKYGGVDEMVKNAGVAIGSSHDGFYEPLINKVMGYKADYSEAARKNALERFTLGQMVLSYKDVFEEVITSK